jgi:hypothetical protein
MTACDEDWRRSQPSPLLLGFRWSRAPLKQLAKAEKTAGSRYSGACFWRAETLPLYIPATGESRVPATGENRVDTKAALGVTIRAQVTQDCCHQAHAIALGLLSPRWVSARRGSRRRRPCRLEARTARWFRCWRGRGAGRTVRYHCGQRAPDPATAPRGRLVPPHGKGSLHGREHSGGA